MLSPIRSRLQQLGLNLAIALAYFLLAKLSLGFAFEQTHASPLWPPSGLGLSALILFGIGTWPGIVLGAFAANLTGFMQHDTPFGMAPVLVSLCIGIGNSAEAVTVKALLNRFASGNPIGNQAQTLGFISIAAISCLISSSVGTSALYLGGLADPALAKPIFTNWWLGDVTGILVFTPFLLAIREPLTRLQKTSQWMESLAWITVLSITCIGVFWNTVEFQGIELLEYTITPILILIAFRCPPVIAFGGIIVASSLAILGTMHGLGAFSGQTQHHQLLLLQGFTGVIAGTILMLTSSFREKAGAFAALRVANESLEQKVAQRVSEVRKYGDDLNTKNMELTHASERLAEKEARLQHIAEAGFEGIVVHEAGVLQFANPAAGQMFGYFHGDMPGMHFETFIAPEAILDARKFFKNGNEVLTVSMGLRKNGSRFHMEVRGRDIPNQGRPMRVVAVRDITENRRTEEIRDHALKSAQAAIASQEQFLHMMSHEARIPLTGILGMTHALESTRLDAEQRHYLEILRNSGDALYGNMNGILDLLWVQSGLVLDAIPFSLEATISGALTVHKERALRKGLRWNVTALENPGPGVSADPIRLAQIFSILASNAIKFTDHGAVDLKIKVETEGEELLLEVEFLDTGIGMDAEVLANIFRPFYQAEPFMKRLYPGSGLGLAICRSLVASMGGELKAESRHGHGSRFSFQVRLQKTHAHQGKVTVIDEEWQSNTQGGRRNHLTTHFTTNSRNRPTILVVEDDPVSLEVVRMLLAGRGFTCESAGTGKEALTLVAQRQFDLVLMDCQLPGMDGFATTAEIRSREAGNAHVPIAAMTAFSLEGDRRRCLASGMDDWLPKPLDPVRFYEVVERLTNPKH